MPVDNSSIVGGLDLVAAWAMPISDFFMVIIHHKVMVAEEFPADFVIEQNTIDRSSREVAECGSVFDI